SLYTEIKNFTNNYEELASNTLNVKLESGRTTIDLFGKKKKTPIVFVFIQLRFFLQLHTEEKPYKCPYCDKSFTLSSCLVLHKRTHAGEKPHHTCRLCCKTFISSRKYKCSVCSKMFMQSSQLMRHKTIHTGEKPFKCPYCNKCFGRASHLKTHRRLHTGEKPFKCTLCERAFTQKAGLIIHLRLHTGEPHMLNHQALELGEGRYICATCHKGFRSVSMLKQHKKSHQGSGMLCCSMCSGAFAHSSYLQLKLHLQNEEQLFHCKVCNKIFVKLSTFEKHCKKHQTEMDECEDEEVKEENSHDPPFELHTAAPPTQSTSEVNTRSKTRAKIKTTIENS
uniref:C2H2-type domain-containing protein n=1 Tax=Sinocyclocheilus anshuiensis TaxID=1608454 RepID=A0A671MXR0_9TELE